MTGSGKSSCFCWKIFGTTIKWKNSAQRARSRAAQRKILEVHLENSGRNIKFEDVKDVFASIFETFPEQAEKAYKKLSKFNQKDMESLLANCTRMSNGHKQIALRIFNSRGKDLDEVYEEYLKSQDQIK